ncbi:hypothetical protein CKQ53_00060 [Lonsdalea britannica]|uniref:Bacterial Ig-like domain-containing protein n=1 Tax=Lonsdalea britannica TaxID=1082704 RepID=A0AAD0SDM4_9GAMM|nr:hypothetical protein CKQ53_00060 [Lonsdalea britannica]
MTGRVGNDVHVGDIVTVTVGGQSYQTNVFAAADGSNIWSVNVPGSVLAGDSQIHASVTTLDMSGNATTATADHGYGVDTVGPDGGSHTADRRGRYGAVDRLGRSGRVLRHQQHRDLFVAGCQRGFVLLQPGR